MSEAEVAVIRRQLMMQIRQDYVPVSVLIFEPPKPFGTVFCLHDFHGVGADFEILGRFLAENRFRVVCPDMPGRGQSGVMPDPQRYTPSTYMAVLMAVVEKFATRRIVLLGKGWGGLLHLLLIKRMQFKLSGLILADVPLKWSVDTDLTIHEGLAIVPKRFATLDSGVAAVLGLTEFAGLDEPVASQMATRRLRPLEPGFAYHLDPALEESVERASGRYYNAGEMLQFVTSRLLYLSSAPLTEQQREAVSASPKPAAAIGSLAPGGRLHFSRPSELMLVLGFLLARKMPVRQAGGPAV